MPNEPNDLSDEQLAEILPRSLATQHPDNASPAPFSDEAYIPFTLEATEAHYNLCELGIEAVMLDYEGKKGLFTPLVDLLEVDLGFFRERLLGKDIHLIPRIPNPRKSRDDPAFLSSLAMFSNSLLVLNKLNIPGQAFSSFIVPDSEEGLTIAKLEEVIDKHYRLHRADYASFGDGDRFPFEGEFLVQGIPLIESVESLMNPERIWEELISERQRVTGNETRFQLSFIARSDPALKAGMVPAILATTVALFKGKAFEARFGIRIPQIIGVGGAPFRGGLLPDLVDAVIRTYPGMAAATVQSAFRYDYPQEKVKSAVRNLHKRVKQSWMDRQDSIKDLTNEDIDGIKSIIIGFKRAYEASVDEIGDLLSITAEQIPNNRDRHKTTNLVNYSRTVGKKQAPRAIKFSAAFYSLGIPPGLLGLRAYSALSHEQKSLLNRANAMIPCWVARELLWCNVENVKNLCFTHIADDIAVARKIALPNKADMVDRKARHARLTGEIVSHLQSGRNVQLKIVEAAKVRGFLG